MSGTTTQLLSSGEFYRLRYNITPIKMHLQTFLSITITQKCQILSFDTLVKNEQYNAVACGSMTTARKKAIAHITTCGPLGK